MSRLKVVLRGTLISEIELVPEKEYIGGRKEGCDIRLQPEKGISREHFKLKFNDSRWQIIAISRFGDVFSLGQKVEQIDLQHGQSFHVPPYDFTFLDVPEAGASRDEGTRIPLGPVSENTKTVFGVVPQVPYIKIVNTTGEIREMLRLEVGEVWVAGRDPSCQIIIPDQRVSRRQFEIYKVNGAYTILDLASVNGTFLNGSPVSSTDPQTLKSGDAISVLDNSMYFELHDPNFKYKVENIEIPSLQQVEPTIAEQYVEELPAETEIISDEAFEDEEMQQIEQYEVPPQINAGEGGPFTGMPNQDQQNQYYNYDAPPMQQQPMPGPIQPKFTDNKVRLILIVVIFLGVAYWISDYLNTDDTPKIAVVNEADPFTKLTPEQQKEVQELYTLAEQMYNQQKYDLALEKIRKIKEILPTGYKDTEKIELEAEQANLTLVQRQKDEEALKEKQEREAKNLEILTACRKLLNPNITAADMSQCLAPVAAFDPTNDEYMRLMSEAEKFEKDKIQKEIEAKNYESQVADLKSMFTTAERVQMDGYAFKAIKKYKEVVSSPLPDPQNLKKKSRDRIAFIEEKIREKSEGSITSADALFKEGKLKEAVVTLREAIIYDPTNPGIKEKIDLYAYELRRQVRTIYQESIIDENYGLIENTETKQGAKDKWKRITEIDLEDGEYYKKAVIKLRRYGVM